VVCLYLTEAAKHGAAARFLGRHDEDVYFAATQLLAEEHCFAADMRRKLRRAAQYPSQMDRWRHLIAAGARPATSPPIPEPEAET
jgi:hypothetical protein